MKIVPIATGIVCVVVFLLFITASVAARPMNQVLGSKEASKDYKDGDMRVVWWGYGYRQRYRSSRLTSPGNRSYVGGGMHGGK
jgi:hypothetical protein